MAPRNRIIIDTDPGVDDVLAMLLAFSAKPEELEILLLSITFGNVDVQSCLRNIVTLFHTIEKELEWRRKSGRPEGFETLKACRPLVAVGAEQPLADQMMMADFFHGVDGLGGIHSSHPHLSPEETWKTLFDAALSSSDPKEAAAAKEVADEVQKAHSMFIPSQRPAHEEMLRLLRENEPDTITICAIGPLTNLAIAASVDPETFIRAKEVVVMGGAVEAPGNVIIPLPPPPSLLLSPSIIAIPVPPFNLIKQPNTPLRTALNQRNQMTPGAEFNTYADSVAAARVYALTSPNPATTMPPVPPAPKGLQSEEPPPPFLGPYPKGLSKQLKVTLFPLDITTPHKLTRGLLTSTTAPLLSAGSPLAEWTTAFLTSTFKKIESLSSLHRPDPSLTGLELHDPLTIWYVLEPDAPDSSSPRWQVVQEDLRVETSGQWTRGSCVVDRRTRKKGDREVSVDERGVVGEVVGDAGNWLSSRAGNRIRVCVRSPGVDLFGRVIVERVFGIV